MNTVEATENVCSNKKKLKKRPPDRQTRIEKDDCHVCREMKTYLSHSQIEKHEGINKCICDRTERSSDNKGDIGYIFIYTDNIHRIFGMTVSGFCITSFQPAGL